MNLRNLDKIKINNPRNLFVFYIAVSLAVFYFFVWLQIASIRDVSGKLIKNKELIKENSDTKNSSVVIDKRIKELKPQITKLDGAFINRDQVIEFITTLEGMKKEHTVEVGEMNIVPPADIKKDKGVTQFSIGISGSLWDVAAYLKDMYNMSYLISVESIHISKQQSGVNSDSSYKSTPIRRSNENADDESFSNRYNLKISGSLFWR